MFCVFVFFCFLFVHSIQPFSIARDSAAAYSDVKCDEILVVTVREAFTFSTDSCISPDFKVDNGSAGSPPQIIPGPS